MKETLSIAEPVRGISWKDLVLQLDVNESKAFPKFKARYLRSMISGTIALIYPERRYETQTNDDVLIIKRLEDVEKVN